MSEYRPQYHAQLAGTQRELRGRKTEYAEPTREETTFSEKAGRLFELLANDRMGDGSGALEAFGQLKDAYRSPEDLYYALLQRVQAVVDRQRESGRADGSFMEAAKGYRSAIEEAWPYIHEQYQLPENAESLEGSYAADELEAFAQFTEMHAKEVEPFHGEDLENQIYGLFYAEDMDASLAYDYREDDPDTQRLLRDMARVGYDTFTYLDAQKKERGLDIRPSVSEDEAWLYCDVGEPVDRSNEIGRFYVNVAPEVVHQYYKVLLAEVYRAGIDARIKIPYKAEVSDLRRYDKLVMYVNELSEEDETALLEIFEQLTATYDEHLEEGKPRMTMPVADAKGGTIKGVAFGQEPGGGESFGGVRSKVLADVYTEARQRGVSVGDAQFDRDASYAEACARENVDPRTPALNADVSNSFFSVVRGRQAE